MSKQWMLWGDVAAASLLVGGCATTIGVHDPEVLKGLKFDTEKRVDVRFCVYLDDDVTIARARELLDAWNREEAEKFNIYVKPVSFTTRKRETISYPTLKVSTQKLPLIVTAHYGSSVAIPSITFTASPRWFCLSRRSTAMSTMRRLPAVMSWPIWGA